MSINLQALGSFEPDELRLLYRTFDDVWSELTPKTHPSIYERTRTAIANALIQAAMAGERDPEKLWCHAMHRARALSTLYWMATDQAPPQDQVQRGLDLSSTPALAARSENS
jgi:hypothetical protein